MLTAKLTAPIVGLLRWLAAALFIGVASTSIATAQVPGFPVQPGDFRIANLIREAFQTKNVKRYSDLLAENVQVYEDGRLIAKDRREWLVKFAPLLQAEGVTFTLSPGFISSGRILFVEYYNSAGSWGGTAPAHCCWSYDAVAYDMVDGKIAVIRKLKGGSEKL